MADWGKRFSLLSVKERRILHDALAPMIAAIEQQVRDAHPDVKDEIRAEYIEVARMYIELTE